MPSWKPIKLPSRTAIALLDLYRLTVSGSLGARCRFYPSCSQYSRQAIVKFGLIRGAGKSLWRLLRCNPWHPGGLDEP